jgi:hypothetical protein
VSIGRVSVITGELPDLLQKGYTEVRIGLVPFSIVDDAKASSAASEHVLKRFRNSHPNETSTTKSEERDEFIFAILDQEKALLIPVRFELVDKQEKLSTVRKFFRVLRVWIIWVSYFKIGNARAILKLAFLTSLPTRLHGTGLNIP